MDTDITVVIPFYQRLDTLQETLASVRQQTLQASEIIIVDDCSGEPFSSDLKKLCGNEQIINLPRNLGVSGARNAGVHAANNNWIAFLDSDDLWHPEKLIEQVEYMKEHPDYCGCHTAMQTVFPDGRRVVHGSKPNLLTAEALIDSSWLLTSSLFIKKSTYIDVGGYDESMRQTEDYDFAWRLVKNNKLLGYIDKPLASLVRGRDDHLSSNWKGFIKGHTKVVRNYSDYYKNLQGNSAPRRHIAKYIHKGGYKCGGIKGYLLRMIALVIAPERWPKPTIKGSKLENKSN